MSKTSFTGWLYGIRGLLLSVSCKRNNAKFHSVRLLCEEAVNARKTTCTRASVITVTTVQEKRDCRDSTGESTVLISFFSPLSCPPAPASEGAAVGVGLPSL